LKRIIAAIILIVVLYGCNQKESSSRSPVLGLENVSDINNTIFLTQGMPKQDLIIGEFFNLALVNDSSDAVVFSPDYSMQLFVLDNDNIIVIDNKFEYRQNSTIILPPFSEGGLENIGINPDFSDMENKVFTLRVVVSGYIEDDESKKVGAYIDLLFEN